MAEDEAIAYDFCAELDRTQSVSDTTYARAVKKFGEQGVVEIIGLKGYYTMLAMMMKYVADAGGGEAAAGCLSAVVELDGRSPVCGDTPVSIGASNRQVFYATDNTRRGLLSGIRVGIC